MIITNLKQIENKIKNKNESGIQVYCPLCNHEVYRYDNIVYVKSKLHEVFAHRRCYDKLF